MDAQVTRSNVTYKLVNIETGKIEDQGQLRIGAMDTQNHLWARGIKTRIIEDTNGPLDRGSVPDRASDYRSGA